MRMPMHIVPDTNVGICITALIRLQFPIRYACPCKVYYTDKEILAPPFFILHFKFVHLQEI